MSVFQCQEKEREKNKKRGEVGGGGGCINELWFGLLVLNGV